MEKKEMLILGFAYLVLKLYKQSQESKSRVAQS